MNWLKQRLQEKSTITALLGLMSVCLTYTKLPPEAINALLGFFVGFIANIRNYRRLIWQF